MATATINPRETRRRLGMNQQQFWSKLGVTQSGGSRYESGRPMPKPTNTLALIAYGTKKQAETAIKQLRSELLEDK